MLKLPKTLIEFQRLFPTEAHCAAYLFEARWPKGFVCPDCGSFEYRGVKNRDRLYECRGCGKQTSITAGTIMHATKLPLRYWFWGAFLAAGHSNGISALQLKKQLGIGSYKTAWLMMNKLRRSMVNPARQKLTGIVEVDEVFLKFRTNKDPDVNRSGRSPVGKMTILTAVEVIAFQDKSGELKTKPGRIRIEPVPDAQRVTLHGFIRRNIEPYSVIVTDGNTAYRGMDEYYLDPTVAGTKEGHLHWTNKVASLLKTLALGTYHGYRRRYIRRYLEEFVYRFNRRRLRPATFDNILGLAAKTPPATLKMIQADPLDSKDAIMGLPNPPPMPPTPSMLNRLKQRHYRRLGYLPPEDHDDYE